MSVTRAAPAGGHGFGVACRLTFFEEGTESMTMRLLFWISALGIGYVYVGYPALLVAWARCRPRRPIRTSSDPAAVPPRISIVIAARNEARRLPARIENLLALDYPSDRRQIIIVSDGSTDDTREVLSPYG